MLLVLSGCLFTLCTTIYVVNRYFSFKLHKDTYRSILLIVAFNMFILLATDFLLPLDIYRASIFSITPIDDTNHSGSAGNIYNDTATDSLDTRSISVPTTVTTARNETFKLIWLLIYWLQFILGWFVIPVLISYVSLKYAFSRTQVKERIIKAIYQNLRFYIACLVALVCGLIYLVSSTGRSLRDFIPMLISLSHLYSLSYTLVLLASGLVLLPRDLLVYGRKPSGETNNSLFIELSNVNDELNEVQLNCVEKATLILSTAELNNGDAIFNEVLNEAKLDVQSKLNLLNILSRTLANPTVFASTAIPISQSSTSIRSLEKLNGTYNKFLTDYYNFIYYKHLSDSIIHTLAQTDHSSLETTLKRFVSVVLGLFFVLLSAIIILLEVIPWDAFRRIVLTSQSHPWYSYTLSFVILAYNTIVSLYSMSKFKFNNFHLISNGNSNPSNVLYYSLYSSRLLFPLCFNLMVLVPKRLTEVTGTDNGDAATSIFSQTLYKPLSVIPLINFLNSYLPILVLTLVPVSYIYDIKRKFLLRILGEEYFYQLFGMIINDPINGLSVLGSVPSETDTNGGTSSRMQEDYEYSLQDGRYLYERASSAFNMDQSNTSGNVNYSDNNGDGNNSERNLRWFSYV